MTTPSDAVDRLGGLAVAVVGLAVAAAALGRLATGASPAVVVPAVVGLAAVAAVTLARRAGDHHGRAALVGLAGGTALAVLAGAWATAAGSLRLTAPPVALAADALAVGVAVAAGAVTVARTGGDDAAAALFADLPNPAARVVREPSGRRRVVAVNDAFLETFGPDRPHVGSPLSACLRPADDDASVRDVLEAEVAARSHLACGVAGGGDGVREFRVTRVVVGADEEFVVLVDVTDRRRRERRLSVLNRVLRHDLRTAVNVIDGRVTALADRAPDGQAELDAVRRQTEGLLRLSKRARQLESVVGGEPTTTETDLGALARDRVAAFREQDHDVTVETDLPDEPVVVRDDGLLGAAVDELLDNVAAHAGPSPTATVGVTREAGMATLTVADDGPGLPETEAAVVERTAESDLDHASGLGLWFVTWVVVELDGEVTVDGDDGTTVAVHVPLATTETDGTVATDPTPAG